MKSLASALGALIVLAIAFFAWRRRFWNYLNKKFEAELTDRRRVERQLAHMASFAEVAPNAILETDIDGHIGYINPAAERKFPDLQQEGKNHPVLEGLGAVVARLRQEGKSLLTRPIKVGRNVYEQQISLLDAGPGIRIYMTDITELKQLDQLKNDFVNMVSHELRTPLTTIKASIKMVEAGLLGGTTGEQKDVLSLALVNIDRLGRMINDLLDISKIEAGKLELHRERISLVALVQELARSFEPLAKERGLELRTVLDQNGIELLADRDKILQVFTNLLHNAMKYTAKGFVEISAKVDDDHVECRVADSGAGITPENLPKVFEKFQQFSGGLQSSEKGTGLGLSLCKGLVELHGGTIRVESERGQGTRFIFELPILGADDLFKEQVQKLFAMAAGAGRPLSLFRFGIQQWDSVGARLGHQKAADLLNRFEALVKTTLRSDHDFVIKSQGAIWLALPGVDKTDGRQIAERIEQGFRDFAFQQAAEVPVDLHWKMATYPDDGQMVEALLDTVAAA